MIHGDIIVVSSVLKKRDEIELKLSYLQEQGLHCGVMSRGRHHVVVRAIQDPRKFECITAGAWRSKEQTSIQYKTKGGTKTVEFPEGVTVRWPIGRYKTVTNQTDDELCDHAHVRGNPSVWYHGTKVIRDKAIIQNDFRESSLPITNLFKMEADDEDVL